MTCQRAATLITHGLDQDLSLSQRLQLGLHALLCSKCRRFRQQVTLLDETLAEFLPRAGNALPQENLPEDRRARIQAALNRQIEDGQ